MSAGMRPSARPLGGGLLLLGAGLVVLTGCGAGTNQQHISGQILYDGQPVPAGEIYFDPDVSKKHDGPQGFAVIKNGRYDTGEAGKPVAAGPHVVRIVGFDGKPVPEQQYGRQLFSEYQTTADIPAQGKAVLDFQVPAQGKAR